MRANEGRGVDAVVMAGGRITGLYARAAGTPIKALVRVADTPVVLRVVRALRSTPGIARVCVVGPEALREVLGEEAIWQREAGPALENLRAGVERLGALDAGRVLICGADLPVIAPDSVRDYLERAPEGAEIVMPVVPRRAFVTAFPGDLGIYVHLREGAFTAGSQFLVRPRALLENVDLIRSLFDRRKSQLAMARTLGAGLVWKLVTRRLSVGELEQRASELTGCLCRAVPDCRPDLAFDIDSVADLRYVERWLQRRS